MAVGRAKAIRAGWLLSMDPGVGDRRNAVLLVEGAEIRAIDPAALPEGVEVIDAPDMIVLPGFVDTHRHTWQSCIRHGCCDMASSAQYFREILGGIGGRYRPEDVKTGTWLGAVSALEMGLVDEVVPAGVFEEKCIETARKMSAIHPGVIRLTKGIIRGSVSELEQYIKLESELMKISQDKR